MLVELRIRDFAVIEDLSVGLGPGLNVLTGETGAGKSIVVGALSLLLGERASSTVVRLGASRATVEAVFDVSGVGGIAERLDQLGYAPEDGLLILRREVAAEGRNRAWVNGSPATVGTLGELGGALVDLHGQHEHQTLVHTAHQRRILDAFAGAQALAARVEGLHSEMRIARRELEDFEERRRELETERDFLRFQLGEIDAAALRPGEDAELAEEARRLEHAEELLQGATEVYRALYDDDDSVVDRLARLRPLLERLARLDGTLDDVRGAVEGAYHELAEAGRTVGGYAEGVELDPRRLEEVRSRRDLIARLERKYGPALADVLETAQRLREELERLEGADHDADRRRAELARTEEALRAAAAELSARRADASRRLAAAVSAVLPDLGFPEGAFHVRVEALPRIGPGGAERVDFLVAPNPGHDPMPLARVASGGELSRVMLALRTVLAEVDGVPVLVFDEIDAGIGGAVGTAVAGALKTVSAGRQVLVVTHLAQIASRADAHLLVEKETDGSSTRTRVRALNGDERIEEVARMLGGDPRSHTSRAHARELLLG